jgi:hypothetical protein
MLFGVAPSAKNSDFTAKLRHPPSVFIYLFWAIYFQGGVY